MTITTIDLYTDISCPWCLIGQHRLEKVLAERFPQVEADIVHHPVLLLPDCPPEGMAIVDMLRSRYGITDPAQAWARPEAEARLSGLDLELRRQPFVYRTQAAQTLIRHARSRGTQHSLSVALAKAYFLDARDISAVDVLADVAGRYGFGSGEVRALCENERELLETEADARRSSTSGVRSVPHFVFARGLELVGGQSEDAIAAALDNVVHRGAEARA